MVSLTYHDEHVAWQQRVQKEITQAHRFQSSNPEPFKLTQSPTKPRKYHSSSKPRARSSVYSSLPAANLNLGAMNVYAEVRGKYSRNANKTINSLPQVAGIISRPSTSGSLTSYNRRFNAYEEGKRIEQEEEAIKSNRPLREELKVSVKEKKEEVKGRGGREVKKEEKGEGEVQDLLVVENDKEDGEDKEEIEGEEVDRVGELEGAEDEEDRKTEVSFKTTTSQRRYIEELERMLKEERIKRIQAEEKLERLSTSHTKRK